MKKNITKENIVLSTIHAARIKGLENVTLKDVANDLTIKSPSLYNHVQNLDGVRILIAIEGLSRLKEIIIESSVGVRGDEAILLISTNYLKFAEENPVLYQAINLYGNLENEEIKQLSEKITTILFKVVSYYTEESDEQTHIVRGIRSLIDGFCTLNVKQGFALDVSIHDSFEYVLRAYLKGIQLHK